MQKDKDLTQSPDLVGWLTSVVKILLTETKQTPKENIVAFSQVWKLHWSRVSPEFPNWLYSHEDSPDQFGRTKDRQLLRRHASNFEWNFDNFEVAIAYSRYFPDHIFLKKINLMTNYIMQDVFVHKQKPTEEKESTAKLKRQKVHFIPNTHSSPSAYINNDLTLLPWVKVSKQLGSIGPCVNQALAEVNSLVQTQENAAQCLTPFQIDLLVINHVMAQPEMKMVSSIEYDQFTQFAQKTIKKYTDQATSLLTHLSGDEFLFVTKLQEWVKQINQISASLPDQKASTGNLVPFTGTPSTVSPAPCNIEIKAFLQKGADFAETMQEIEPLLDKFVASILGSDASYKVAHDLVQSLQKELDGTAPESKDDVSKQDSVRQKLEEAESKLAGEKDKFTSILESCAQGGELLGSLVSFAGHPKLGNQIKQVVNSGVKIAGVVATIATGTAVGGPIGAGIAIGLETIKLLTNLIGGESLTPDQIILKQIKELTDHIDKRFDRVEMALEVISKQIHQFHLNVKTEFIHLNQQVLVIQQQLSAIQSQLGEMSAQLTQLEGRFRQLHSMTYRITKSNVMNLYRLSDHRLRLSDAEKYSGFLITWAIQFNLDDELTGHYSPKDAPTEEKLCKMLKGQALLDQLNPLASFARENLGISINKPLVHPLAWADAARTYMYLIRHTPELNLEKIRFQHDIAALIEAGTEFNRFIAALKANKKTLIGLVNQYQQAILGVIHTAYKILVPAPRMLVKKVINHDNLLDEMKNLDEKITEIKQSPAFVYLKDKQPLAKHYVPVESYYNHPGAIPDDIRREVHRRMIEVDCKKEAEHEEEIKQKIKETPFYKRPMTKAGYSLAKSIDSSVKSVAGGFRHTASVLTTGELYHKPIEKSVAIAKAIESKTEEMLSIYYQRFSLLHQAAYQEACKAFADSGCFAFPDVEIMRLYFLTPSITTVETSSSRTTKQEDDKRFRKSFNSSTAATEGLQKTCETFADVTAVIKSANFYDRLAVNSESEFKRHLGNDPTFTVALEYLDHVYQILVAFMMLAFGEEYFQDPALIFYIQEGLCDSQEFTGILQSLPEGASDGLALIALQKHVQPMISGLEMHLQTKFLGAQSESSSYNMVDEVLQELRAISELHQNKAGVSSHPKNVAKSFVALGSPVARQLPADQKGRRGSDSETYPLHAAIMQNLEDDIIKDLIEAKADVNAENTSQQTPVMLAAAQGKLDTVKLLFANGAAGNKLTLIQQARKNAGNLASTQMKLQLSS